MPLCETKPIPTLAEAGGRKEEERRAGRNVGKRKSGETVRREGGGETAP